VQESLSQCPVFSPFNSLLQLNFLQISTVIEFHDLANFVGMAALARFGRFRRVFSSEGSYVSFDSLRRPIYRHQEKQ
jgi:hypothetical protein